MFHTCNFRFYQTFGWKLVSWCYEGLVVLTTFSSTKSGVTSPITSPWYPSPKRSRSTCNMQSLVVKNSDKKFNKRWNWTFLNPLFLFYCAEWSFRSAHNQLPCLWFWLYFPDRKKHDIFGAKRNRSHYTCAQPKLCQVKGTYNIIIASW